MSNQDAYNLIREKLKKKAEDILKFSIDHSEDVIAIFDTELNYILANDSACKLLGKQKYELEGSNILHVFPQLTASVSHRHLLTALFGKTILEAISEGNITKEGAKFFSDYYPLKDNENIHAVLVVTKKIYFP